MTKKSALKVVSLFAGCGGLDLGFKGGFEVLGKKYPKNNFEVIWANDINEKACQTLGRYFKMDDGLSVKQKEGIVIAGDLVKMLDEGYEFPKCDIVLGGFPCQDFSHAGKRRGFKSKRGRLYLSMLEVIKKTKPKAFVAENVKGLLTMNNGAAVKIIEEDFRSAGYETTMHLYHAADYGVPQTRERVMIVGIRKDLNKKFVPPKPTHAKNPIGGLKPWVTISEAIGDLEDDKKHEAMPNSGYSQAKMCKGSQGNTVTNPNKPGPTMRAEHHGNVEFHYKKSRRLSAREAARIQTFPDDFIFVSSTTDAYRQVGNAVPPVLGWHVARQLQKTLL